jgi:hypothetical protein
VDRAIAFLSKKILHLQILTVEDLCGTVHETKLEGFYFAGLELSTAIIDCLIVAIKLGVASKFKSEQAQSVSC